MGEFEDFTLDLPGWSLAGQIHHPPQGEPVRGLAVIAHGLFSDMSSIKLTALGRALAEIGLATARFDGLGCGRSSGGIARTTLTARAQGLAATADHLRRTFRLDGPLWLIGSSFGGSAALLQASGDDSVAGVVAWAAPTDFRPLLARWEQIKEVDMEPVFFDDLAGLNLPDRLAGRRPVLLVHALEDEVVPVEQPRKLLPRLGSGSRLAILCGSDHAFHAPGAAEAAIAETIAFIRARL